MQICEEFGVTHSKFLNWDSEDRNKTIAWYLHKAEFCQMCGTAPWEWDPDQGGSRFAYEAYQDICRGCEVKEFTERGAEHYDGSFISLRHQILE